MASIINFCPGAVLADKSSVSQSYIYPRLMKARRHVLPMLKGKMKRSIIIKSSTGQGSHIYRDALQFKSIEVKDLVLPLFIHEGDDNIPIGIVPGCSKLGWKHGLLDEIYKAVDVGVKRFALIPKASNTSKLNMKAEAYYVNGLVPQAIRLLKDKNPEIVLYTDVALDLFTPDGNDFIRWEGGRNPSLCDTINLKAKIGKVPAAYYYGRGFLTGLISNDEIVQRLCEQAVSQARAGADVVCPSGSMDEYVIMGIRSALDSEGFYDVSVMSCTSRHASSYYSLGCKALDLSQLLVNEKMCDDAIYRGDFAENGAIVAEGADILMVKPACFYAAVTRKLRTRFSLPIAGYQVFPQYTTIRAAENEGVDVDSLIMRSLRKIRGAGADIIFSHFACRAASLICGMK